MKLFFFGSDLLGQSEYDLATAVDPEALTYLQKLESQMLAVMNQFGLYGLAAPQVGVGIQMAVVKLSGGRKVTLLNPRIERMYGSETTYAESCISCPPGANSCPVPRMQFIDVVGSSLDVPGVERDWHFTSQDARVVQHEIDHLRGAFFFDRAELVEKAKVIERFHQWKRTFKQSGAEASFGGGSNGITKGHRQLVHVPPTHS